MICDHRGGFYVGAADNIWRCSACHQPIPTSGMSYTYTTSTTSAPSYTSTSTTSAPSISVRKNTQTIKQAVCVHGALRLNCAECES